MIDLQMADARLLSEIPNLTATARVITWLESKINYDVMVTFRANDANGLSVLQISFHYVIHSKGMVLQTAFPRPLNQTSQAQWIIELLDNVNATIKRQLIEAPK